jgi:hypothetical protein
MMMISSPVGVSSGADHDNYLLTVHDSLSVDRDDDQLTLESSVWIMMISSPVGDLISCGS